MKKRVKKRLVAASAVCAVLLLCALALVISIRYRLYQPLTVILPNYLTVLIQPATTTPATLPAGPVLYNYIEVVESCGPYYTGDACVNMRSGPGTKYPVIAKLRNGMVLKVANTVTVDGVDWYKIGFDEKLRYPERVTENWYVAADYVHLFTDDGVHTSWKGLNATSTKRIEVDLSEQMLYAYDGDTLFMKEPISSGLELTPTDVGTFAIYKMTPTRYMQGPIPGVSDQYYDLPGVPWNLYFTYGGAVIHGAYWHNHFGHPWSHGCVNLSPENAKKLYEWAELGLKVIVRK